MSLSINLTETANTFMKKMSAALAPLLNRSIFKNKQRVIRKVRQFIEKQIRIQPEVQELVSGAGPMSLNAMLGINSDQGHDAVNEIINIITHSVSINIKNFDRNLNGGVDLTFANIDMEQISSKKIQLISFFYHSFMEQIKIVKNQAK